MKGFDNNEHAVRRLESFYEKADNYIREIYNLGYKAGYKDGVADAMQKITEHIFNEVKE